MILYTTYLNNYCKKAIHNFHINVFCCHFPILKGIKKKIQYCVFISKKDNGFLNRYPQSKMTEQAMISLEGMAEKGL